VKLLVIAAALGLAACARPAAVPPPASAPAAADLKPEARYHHPLRAARRPVDPALAGAVERLNRATSDLARILDRPTPDNGDLR